MSLLRRLLHTICDLVFIVFDGLASRRHYTALFTLHRTTLGALDCALADERVPVKVGLVLRKVLEVDVVSVFGPDGLTVNENVVLRVHQVLERLHVDGTLHRQKQFRIFQVGAELVENVRLRHVRVVELVELSPVVRALGNHPLLQKVRVKLGVNENTYRLNDLRRDHSRDQSQHGNDRLDLPVTAAYFIIVLAHQVEEARGLNFSSFVEIEQAE